MENLMVILDAGKVNMNTVEFACYLANLTHSKLNLYFMERMIGEETPKQKLLLALPYVETVTAGDIPENRTNAIHYAENEKIVCEACTNRGANYKILKDKHPNLQQLKMESRFADLIVLDPEISLGEEEGEILSSSLERFLHASECPILFAPYAFYGIDELLFAYDGSRGSLSAIRSFGRLFPELNHLHTTVIQISDGDEFVFGENKKGLEQIASVYPNLQFKHLKGEASDQMLDLLIGKTRTAVVLGAFGRGFSSMMFKPSLARMIIRTLNLPVFISHPN
ncbi:MAG: hypothetical protein ACHQET_11545 [Chitinophagales bacterium]